LARKAEWQLAGKDPVGRQHIETMVALEDKWKAEGNPRKFIKVHRVWDVRDFLGDRDVRELANEECGYCSI
jgi:predicted metal-dependent hydrolase